MCHPAQITLISLIFFKVGSINYVKAILRDVLSRFLTTTESLHSIVIDGRDRRRYQNRLKNDRNNNLSFLIINRTRNYSAMVF